MTTNTPSAAKDALLKCVAKNTINSDSISWLLTGDSGSGKTTMAATGRQPILYHSFDPKGTVLPSIRKMIEQRKVVVLNGTENEDNTAPFVYELWKSQFKELFKAGTFNNLGTYVIDPLTGFGTSVMNRITQLGDKTSGPRTNTVPQIPDYWHLMTHMENVVRRCCNLPCDFVMTAHLKQDKDTVTGGMTSSLLVDGQSAVRIPPLFSEVLMCGTDAKGNHNVLTCNKGRYRAHTRIGGGVFDEYEAPNLMALRKKAGCACEHLPLLEL